MAAVTRLGLCCIPRAPYGSFAGREENTDFYGGMSEDEWYTRRTRLKRIGRIGVNRQRRSMVK